MAAKVGTADHCAGYCALASLLVLVLFGGAVARGQTNIAIPPANEILKTLRHDRPRLFADRQGFAALQKRVASDLLLKKWTEQIRQEAGRILTQPVSKYEIPDGLRLLDTSRRVLARIQTLAFMYRLDGDKQWAERAWKELDAAANFPDWNPRHFLDTAEMTHAFALGYDWLYDAWTPEQRKTLKTAIIEKGLTPALGVYRGSPGKSSKWNLVRHNWNQVCNGGISIGALAVADEEPALAGELLSEGCKSVQLAMAEFAPDGAWKEGPGYWHYATTYNCAMLASLESALGTDFDLRQIPGFSECGTFPISIRGPIGKTFNYGDGGDGTIRAPHLFWLAKAFNHPDYAAYEAQVASPAPLDVLWYDPTMVKTSSAALDRYFRDAEVVTMRSGWNEPDALFIGFKGGDNKANHSNLDLGTFVLDAFGKRWLVDLGADNYNLPGYFSTQRWSYYRMRAEGHNTLVLNPAPAPDQDPRATSKIIRYESTPSRVVAVADLTAAYRNNAQSVKRGLAMLDRKRVLLQDEIECSKAADVWWFAHTPAKIDIAADGASATLALEGKQLLVRLLSPANARFEKLSASPLPASAHPETQNENRGIQKLAIHLPATVKERVAVVFSAPAESGQLELLPLAAW